MQLSLLLLCCICDVLACCAASHNLMGQPLHTLGPAPETSLRAILPENTLTHFCVITGWDTYNETLGRYAEMLGVNPPTPGIAGGFSSNGTYNGKRLIGTTKIAFMELNNMTRMEFLAGDPTEPSWWRDVYDQRGFEIHHMGYAIRGGIWQRVKQFEIAGLGKAVQWARWGVRGQPTSGCYVYMDSQATLGVTTEILANDADCDDLPPPPPHTT